MELERRDFAIDGVRVAQDARSVEGYAAVFNKDSLDLGGFIERIAQGAFKRSIETSPLIHAFWNHDSGLPLGSTRSGKLALSEDDNGLHFKLDTKRLSEAQLDAIADGDVRMSFGFTVMPGGYHWEDREGGGYTRTLLDVELHEVSPVTMPAYPDTSATLRSPDVSVALRSLDAYLSLTNPEDRSGVLRFLARSAMDIRIKKSRS